MTWFKENKFLAGLLCITLLLAVLILFLGSAFNSNLEKIQAEVSDKQSKLEKMKTLNPYPTMESAKEKEVNLIAVLAKANEAREKLLAFRPETMDDVSGAVFSENLTATVSRVKDLFPENGALPKSFNLGFEAYSGGPPKEGATGVLTYQLGAMEYLFKELAASGVTKVQNLSRVKLPAESGNDWEGAAGGKRGKMRNASSKRVKKGKGRRGVAPFETLPAVAHRLPFELVFKASEGSARKFLAQIADSEDYFFETRLARVLNPSPIPSGGKARVADKPKEGAFGMFEIEGAESTADVTPSSEQILNKVSGGDELIVFLRADLLLFIAEKKFPELK